MTPTIYTIGHSTRTLDDLIATLKSHRVQSIADVRKYPGSRRLPWFNASSLAESLPPAGLAYHPFPALGGRRKPSINSPNGGWRNASFRGYADYMQTVEFRIALEALMEQARDVPTAIMCAEAVPWRCHRSLIADALLVRGWQVIDLFDARKAAPHALTPFAKVDGSAITYPALPEQPADESPAGSDKGL
jgi:uncharacterized protein (DUF488 family)